MILGWLTRLAATIALVAVIGFDGLSIGLAHVSANDDAKNAAQAASQVWQSTHGNGPQTLAAAQQVIAQHGETLVPGSLQVLSDGTVLLRIHRQASTVLVRRLGPLRSWADVLAKARIRYQATP